MELNSLGKYCSLSTFLNLNFGFSISVFCTSTSFAEILTKGFSIFSTFSNSLFSFTVYSSDGTATDKMPWISY